MNFLAHTALVGPSDALRLGAFLGDFVKAPLDSAPKGFSKAIVQGICLHRHIDSHLDAHPIFHRSRQRVSPTYRRVAGIMVDVFYDHFLAKHWAMFYEQPLTHFSLNIYDLLDQNFSILPPRLAQLCAPMRAHNWLVSYRSLPAIHATLNRMSQRLSRPHMLVGSADELEANYAGFEEDFFLIYTAMQRFVAQCKRTL